MLVERFHNTLGYMNLDKSYQNLDTEAPLYPNRGGVLISEQFGYPNVLLFLKTESNFRKLYVYVGKKNCPCYLNCRQLCEEHEPLDRQAEEVVNVQG